MGLRGSDTLSDGLTNAQLSALSYVYLVSLSLSLLGSVSVLLVSVVRRRYLNEQSQPLLQLALADLLATSVLLFTTAMNFIEPESLPEDVRLCERGLPLALMFYCVSFLLVVIYAYESKQAVQGWRERTNDEDRNWESQQETGTVSSALYLLVWMVPVAIYFCYVITEALKPATVINATNRGYEVTSGDPIVYCTSCLLLLHIRNDTCTHSDLTHVMFVKCFVFFGLLAVIICCTVMYYKVNIWFQRYNEQRMLQVDGDGFDRRHLKRVYRTSQSMVLVVVLCWSPAFILVGLSFTKTIPHEQLFPLYVIQALTVSLQGFLDSIVYGWLRRNFREAALGERALLLADAPKAFYDESLTATQ